MSKSNQHVVPNPKGGWSVRKTGATRASKVFGTKNDAVDYARSQAKEKKLELFIHNRDGTIAQKSSYGQDPAPPKDKK